MKDGKADAAVVIGPEGDRQVADAMQAGGLQLMSLASWSEGADFVRYPFLREARIAGGTYRARSRPIDTLRTQLVLAGRAPVEGDAVGDQGPAAVVAELQPISATALEELNQSLPANQLVDPALPVAASLAPLLPQIS